MGRSDVNSSKTNLTSCITVTKSIQIFLIFVLNIYSKQKTQHYQLNIKSIPRQTRLLLFCIHNRIATAYVVYRMQGANYWGGGGGIVGVKLSWGSRAEPLLLWQPPLLTWFPLPGVRHIPVACYYVYNH